jgi:hypothetical protein
MISELFEYDLHDVYRQLNGYSHMDFSWDWKDIGTIFDHIFTSSELASTEY